MYNWIPINLPWYQDGGFPEYVKYPDHTQQIKEIFGPEYGELKSKLDKMNEGYNPDSPVWLSSDDFTEQVKLGNPHAVMIARYRELLCQVDAWEDQQIDNKEVDKQNSVIREAFNKKQEEEPGCFQKSKWCKPGVLIEFKSEDGATVQQLLGHMNTSGGVCDDCRGIENDNLVIRCKIVWEDSNEKV